MILALPLTLQLLRIEYGAAGCDETLVGGGRIFLREIITAVLCNFPATKQRAFVIEAKLFNQVIFFWCTGSKLLGTGSRYSGSMYQGIKTGMKPLLPSTAPFHKS